MSSGSAGDPASPVPPGLGALIERHTQADPPRDSAAAATMIVLRSNGGEEQVLLEERAVRDRDPASGQISLPGGHVESRDPDLRATALRELEEEVGLAADDLAAPPHFVTIGKMAFRQLDVAVFAAAVRPDRASRLTPQAEEVRSLFWLPRTALERNRRVRVTTHRGPLEVDANVYEGYVLWGFTRRVLLDFFEVD